VGETCQHQGEQHQVSFTHFYKYSPSEILAFEHREIRRVSETLWALLQKMGSGPHYADQPKQEIVRASNQDHLFVTRLLDVEPRIRLAAEARLSAQMSGWSAQPEN
jgi:hypothetical protein